MGSDWTIYGVDVGVVRGRGGFAWWSADHDVPPCEDRSGQGDKRRDFLTTWRSIEGLASSVAKDLGAGKSVAMGWECPLFLPAPKDGDEFTATWSRFNPVIPRWIDRRVEESDASSEVALRPWYTQAGAGTAITGLVELVWFLRELSSSVPQDFIRVTTSREDDPRPGTIWIWEAFISGLDTTGIFDDCDEHVDAARMAASVFEALHADGNESWWRPIAENSYLRVAHGRQLPVRPDLETCRHVDAGSWIDLVGMAAHAPDVRDGHTGARMWDVQTGEEFTIIRPLNAEQVKSEFGDPDPPVDCPPLSESDSA